MKKKIILWGGFSDGELYTEISREGFEIPATFHTKKKQNFITKMFEN